MSEPLSNREMQLSKAWKQAAEDMNATTREVVLVTTAILGAAIIMVARDRDDAMTGVEKLNNDLKRQVERRWPI
jgi:hypothetical protein